MNKILLRWAWLITSISLMFLTKMPLAIAQTSLSSDDLGMSYMEEIGLTKEDPRIVVARIIQVSLGVLGTLGVVLVIYAGFLWMTSQGNQEKIDKAKQILKSAIIGLLIILMSFAIVSFIINRLISSNLGGDISSPTDPSSGGTPGLGALGAGIIKSVYPTPGQTNVSRNTSIIVTFHEKMKVSTICEGANDQAGVCNNSNIVAENIRFYQSDLGDSTTTNLTNSQVKVSSNDGMTFVFVPVEYLGSASGEVWQTIKLTTDLKKNDNQPAFTLGDFVWQFEISNLVDLTPPQVLSGGIFPFPDNDPDPDSVAQPATAAKATVQVLGIPQPVRQVSVGTPVAQGNSGSAIIEGNYNCSESGQITVTVIAGTPLKAQAVGVDGLISGESVNGERINLGCGLVLVKKGQLAAGNGWTVDVQANEPGDTLTVGNQIYRFVSEESERTNEIAIASSAEGVARKIVDKINDHHLDVRAESSLGEFGNSGNQILLTSRQLGSAGNSLSLLTDSSGLMVLSSFSGGADQSYYVEVADQPDTPRNAIIQINFSEAINPLTVVGTSDQVSSTIKVIERSGQSNRIVDGKFVISNQYQTLEFIPDEECGENSCGDTVYCLPASSKIAIEIKAAALATCSNNTDCLSKSPYSQCLMGSCAQGEDDYYPLADLPLMSGVVDASLNSLDGNRNIRTVGPRGFYNENLGRDSRNSQDSYTWSFFTNNEIDLTPPKLKKASLSPVIGKAGGSLNQLVEFSFNKMMMSSTLSSGEALINGHYHRLVNLFSTGIAPSYWVTNKLLKEQVEDIQHSFSKVIVNHSLLSDATKYYVEIGSGVKDLYQNCFKPCADDSACAAGLASCCEGQPNSSSICN